MEERMMEGLNQQSSSARYKEKAKHSSLALFGLGVGFFIGSYLFSVGTVGFFETTKPIVIKVAGDDFSNVKWINAHFNSEESGRAPAALSSLKSEDSVGVMISFKNSQCDLTQTVKEVTKLISQTKAQHVLVALADPIQSVQECNFRDEVVAAQKYWQLVSQIKQATGKRVHGGFIQNESFLEDQEMVMALINLYRETGEKVGHSIRYVGLKGFTRGSDPNWANENRVVNRFFGQNSILVEGIGS